MKNNLKKPILYEELEAQLSLAKDRLFIMKYYDMERELADLKPTIENLKVENEHLKALIRKDIKYDVTKTLYQVEKDTVLSALKAFNGNKAYAAHALGITLKILYNKLHEYGENV